MHACEHTQTHTHTRAHTYHTRAHTYHTRAHTYHTQRDTQRHTHTDIGHPGLMLPEVLSGTDAVSS